MADSTQLARRNPDGLGLWSLWREDLATHDRILLAPGFWALAVHRFGTWRLSLHPVLRRLLGPVHLFLFKMVQWLSGIELEPSMAIGRRVRIWHHSGIIVSARAIGNDVQLRQNTTVGTARPGDNRHMTPVIEDRVDIGAGAVIAGRIRIGHDTSVGAKAVVVEDVAPRSLAVGVPARVVARGGHSGDRAASR